MTRAPTINTRITPIRPSLPALSYKLPGRRGTMHIQTSHTHASRRLSRRRARARVCVDTPTRDTPVPAHTYALTYTGYTCHHRETHNSTLTPAHPRLSGKTLRREAGDPLLLFCFFFLFEAACDPPSCSVPGNTLSSTPRRVIEFRSASRCSPPKSPDQSIAQDRAENAGRFRMRDRASAARSRSRREEEGRVGIEVV